MTLGAGFALDAIRRHNAYMRQSRQFSRTSISGHIPVSTDGDAREVFECQHLCPACGRLGDSPAPGGCPACGGVGSIDLGHTATAEALRANEEQTRGELPRSARSLQALATCGLFVGLSYAGWALLVQRNCVATLPYMLVLGAAIAAAGLAYAGLEHALGRLTWKARAPLVRSRRPIPREVPLPERRGFPQTRDRLYAPLSGTPCLGWRIEAILHTRAGTHTVIDDSRSASFVLTDVALERDEVAVAGKGRRVSLARASAALEARIRRFLRERGCFTYDGQWQLRETVIPLEVPIALRSKDGVAEIAELSDDPSPSPCR